MQRTIPGTVDYEIARVERLEARIRELEAAVLAEREACAKIADKRAEICRDAMSWPLGTLPQVEVHCMNEALHIASAIRARGDK